jgi:hypothetical protein
MRKYLYIGLTAISLLQACQKDQEAETVKADPIFTIPAPQENQVYNYGDTIRINGTITALYDMHGYNVKLYNETTQQFVVNQGYHQHASNFTVSETWKNTVSDTAKLKLTIDAAIDHEGGIATKEVTVTCYPQQ